MEIVGKDGRRNAGIDAEGAELIAFSRAFDRVVESIVVSASGSGDFEVQLFLGALWYHVSWFWHHKRDDDASMYDLPSLSHRVSIVCIHSLST